MNHHQPPTPGDFLHRESAARFLNGALGGKDNFAIDRALLAQAIEITADFELLVATAERFRQYAVRSLVGAGIDQFIDCGPGLPEFDAATGALAQFCCVLYVEQDPMALSRARGLLNRDGTAVIQADLYDPAGIRAHPGAGLLDWDQPIGLIHSHSWLRSPTDAAALADAMKGFVAELPAGSHTASCHLELPSPAHHRGEQVLQATELQDLLTSAVGGGWFHTRAQIEALFGDQKPLAPGLVPALQLLDQTYEPARPDEQTLCDFLIAGIARVREPAAAGAG
ncbi:SAM-dependent methyltransferase [Kribbella sp. CA-293567]|uniref:SAM-dependent methyltransferase n=1 Tax=Kribbella sp. CA-293567 TaxID=3002436 RepID=UPI0022DE0D21|nr:SAM-dependent methyltransferase [Kribbella sp. CA-293567]WBQ06826.1 SAM-dependent methyltransferase [Kribbella sp. CA-293567]